MHHKPIVSALLLALIVGCSNSTSQDTGKNPAETPGANQVATQQRTPPPPEYTAKTKQKQAADAMSAAGITMESAENPEHAQPAKADEPQSPTPGPGMMVEKADVGSTEKGRRIGPGIISTPVDAYFATRERIMFAITVPDALRAYKFEHDFKGPKSHEEFMEQVIKKNGIRLPALPRGHRYVYDPKAEQLMVERPQ